MIVGMPVPKNIFAGSPIIASKGFVKEGKNNRLRDRDIKKITDAVINRTDEPKFSRKVERDFSTMGMRPKI